jgi:serine/threonine protein kinase
MEIAGKRSLLEFVNDFHGLKEARSQELFCQLLSAIYYMHHVKGIVHRDLKLENIMIDNGLLKIIDFGFSHENDGMSTLCGSRPWLAPEIITGAPYTEAVDMWGLGVCLYAMISGRLPFNAANSSILFNEIVSTEPQPLDVSNDCQHFISRLLEKNHKLRMTASEAIKHPWITRCRTYSLLFEGGFDSNDFHLNMGDENVIRQLVDLGYDGEYVSKCAKIGSVNEVSLAYCLLKSKRIREAVISAYDNVCGAHISLANVLGMPGISGSVIVPKCIQMRRKSTFSPRIKIANEFRKVSKTPLAVSPENDRVRLRLNPRTESEEESDSVMRIRYRRVDGSRGNVQLILS